MILQEKPASGSRHQDIAAHRAQLLATVGKHVRAKETHAAMLHCKTTLGQHSAGARHQAADCHCGDFVPGGVFVGESGATDAGRKARPAGSVSVN
jgi:hypothetical protein